MATTAKKKAGRPRELDPTVAINARIPDYVWAELHARAERRGESMGALVRQALMEWLFAEMVQPQAHAGKGAIKRAMVLKEKKS